MYRFSTSVALIDNNVAHDCITEGETRGEKNKTYWRPLIKNQCISYLININYYQLFFNLPCSLIKVILYCFIFINKIRYNSKFRIISKILKITERIWFVLIFLFRDFFLFCFYQENHFQKCLFLSFQNTTSPLFFWIYFYGFIILKWSYWEYGNLK